MSDINEYVNNKKLVELIIKWKKDKDNATYNEIGKMALLIAANNLRRQCFSKYSYDRKAEMLSDAVWYIIKKLPTYDPSIKQNPFSYFTKTVYNAIRQKINEFKKRDNKIKRVSYIENLEEQSSGRSFVFKEDNSSCFDDVDTNMEPSRGAKNKFITDGEIKHEIKQYKKGIKRKHA
jgi:hypothetical protein